jgi:lipoprotein-releasing system permease protein
MAAVLTNLELSIAWRYLRSRRGSKMVSAVALIAVTGIAVAVSALIVIMGVMSGLREDFREKILIGSPDVQMLPYGADFAMNDWRSRMALLERQPGVEKIAPFVVTQALLVTRSTRMRGVFVRGLLPDGPATPHVTAIREHVVKGDFTFASGGGAHHGAVLGVTLAESLGLHVGRDSITLLTMDRRAAESGGSGLGGMPLPYAVRLPVTGTFGTGLYEYDASYVVVSLEEAQALANIGDAITGLEIKTRTRWVAPQVAERLQALVGTEIRALDWHQQNNALFTLLNLEKLGLAVILMLVVLVAAFNVVGTLVMIVTDKTKEIGILRAMGMPARSIRRVFVVQGLAIGVVGTFAGLAVGLLLSQVLAHTRLIPLNPKIYYIDHLPVSTQLTDVAGTVLASLMIAGLATIYPSFRAARLFPVEAIRAE